MLEEEREMTDATANADMCFEAWKKLVEMLKPVSGTAIVMVDKEEGSDVNAHTRALMKVFEVCKKNGTNCLISNGGGYLGYKFRGEEKPEAVDVIAVPSFDTVFYISLKGRVVTTGTRSNELAAAIGGIALGGGGSGA
jgi:hypothetical protein